MVVNLKVKKGDIKIDIQITDVQEIKKGTLKGFFKDYDVLVISYNKDCFAYPIKNIVELKINKGA